MINANGNEPDEGSLGWMWRSLGSGHSAKGTQPRAPPVRGTRPTLEEIRNGKWDPFTLFGPLFTRRLK